MYICISNTHICTCVPYVRRKELESEIRAQVDELMREELNNLKLVCPRVTCSDFHTCIHMYECTYIRKYACMYICANLSIIICCIMYTYVRTYPLCVYTYVCIHVRTRIFKSYSDLLFHLGY